MSNPISIPATFDGRVFVPDQPVPEVPVGAPLQLTVEARDPAKPPPLPPLTPETRAIWIAELEKEYPPQPGEETLADLIDRIAVDVPDWPADGAAQHDHYLYGTPKR